MKSVFPLRSSPKGIAFGGMVLSSTKTFEATQRWSTALRDDALTHTSGIGEPFFLKLAVLSLASSSQLFFLLVIVVVDSLLSDPPRAGYVPGRGDRPYSCVDFEY